ncbi:transporter [Streptomyces sp. G1]|uniref:transporter n=1 Tax=Streptomyces sp. G1 TaxID=361572 RepID=UPI00202F495D|nr:transporter [Streptomyces sp. G1]MCM1967962.1 transporter [Streptomyces sp. G1]
MGDLRAFRVRGGGAAEIPGSSVALERQLQTLIEANMETMLGIRFLATEYPTGRHRGRIDSLGLDENGTPVIIEYKRTRDKELIPQALSYLAWLEDNHHEFESLVKSRLGGEVAESVDWSNPRIVCVAGDFTPHSAVALEVIGRRIDLVAYRAFEEVLTLRLVASVAGTSSPGRGRAPTGARAGMGSASTKSVQQYLDESPPDLQELFASLDDVLLSHGDVQKESQLHYFAYRRIKSVATVRVQPRNRALVVNLRVDPSEVELEAGFARDVSGVGCVGLRGGIEVRIRSQDDLTRAGELIRRSVEAG